MSVEENIENGKRAMDTVISTHSDVPSAMHRDDVGDIDFIWGTPGTGKNFKRGKGISQIIAKRNSEGKDVTTVIQKIVEAIANGTDTEIQGSNGDKGEARLKIHYNGYTVILSSKNKEHNAWLLTGWEDDKKEASVNASGEGDGSTTATAARPMLTRSSGDTDASSTSTIDESSKKVNGSTTGEKSNAEKKGTEAPKEEKPQNNEEEIERDYIERIYNFYSKGLITFNEAEKRLNEELVKIITQPKATKELLDKYSHIVSIYLKITRQRYAEDHKRVTDNTLKTNEKKRTKEEIKQDEKALKALGEETYNKAYRYAVYILRKDEATRESAFESALIFSKMSQAFKKNYGIDIPIPMMVSKKAEEKDGFITLGVYKPKENGLVISKGHRNASTLIHEGTHWYDEMLSQFSSLSDDEIDTYFNGDKENARNAIAKIKADLKVINDWASFSEEKLNDYIGTNLENEFTQTVDAIHSPNVETALRGLRKFRRERLARGFEKFLIDGKAKSNGLKAVFERIKNFMIAIIKGNKDIKEQEIAKHELPKEIQDLYDSMINGNRNEKAGMNKTSTDNEKVKRSTESNAPHDVGTISSDTIRESVSEPLYQVTNRELSADDEIKVTDIKTVPNLKESTSVMKKRIVNILKGKSFTTSKDGIQLIFNNSNNTEHFATSDHYYKQPLERRALLSDESIVQSLLENSVYVEEENNKHNFNSLKHVVQLYTVAKFNDEYHRIKITAFKMADGTFSISSADLYNIDPRGKISNKKIKKTLAPTHKQVRDNLQAPEPFYTISIADLLDGVNDRYDEPYVINGKLNYDERIFMTSEQLGKEMARRSDAEKKVISAFTYFTQNKDTPREHHVEITGDNGKHILFDILYGDKTNKRGRAKQDIHKDSGEINLNNDEIYIDPNGKIKDRMTVSREELNTLLFNNIDDVPSDNAMKLLTKYLSPQNRNALTEKYKDTKELLKDYATWRKLRHANPKQGMDVGKIFQRIADNAKKLSSIFTAHDRAIVQNLIKGKVWESEKNNKSAEKLSNILDKSLEEPLNQMVDISTLKDKVKGKIKETVKGKDHNNDHITAREREK